MIENKLMSLFRKSRWLKLMAIKTIKATAKEREEINLMARAIKSNKVVIFFTVSDTSSKETLGSFIDIFDSED